MDERAAEPRTERAGPAQASPFVERPTEFVVPDAWRLAAVPGGIALVAAGVGWGGWALLALGLAGFVVAFFRNPSRPLPGGPREVLAAADGRVLEVAEIEPEDGQKALRIATFLSVFDVHVNRMPLAGEVVSVERAGWLYRAAFRKGAERENARCTVTLRTEQGERFQVVQIVGAVARRIVCHPRVGERVERGMRFGLIRFGSRTDVVLPSGSQALVATGDRVRGGLTILARLPDAGAEGA